MMAQGFLETYELVRHFEPFDQVNGLYNAEYNTLTGNSAEWSKVMGVGYDFDDIRLGKLGMSGSAYLFDSWEQPAKVDVDKKRYIFPRVNYNVFRGEFMSKMENDSIFILNFKAIDRIIINNRTFRNIYNSKEGTYNAYEVIFENKEFAIVKGYNVSFVKSSPNPMVNRPKPKVKKTSSYFILKNGQLSSFKFKKSGFLSILGAKAEKALAISKAQQLSFKKDEDVKKILQQSYLD